MSVVHVEGLNRTRLCRISFLDDYSKFTAKSESPPDFHIWTGLSVVASALSRNVWVDQGLFKVYPNLFVVLVGKSAIAKKSSAIGVGERLLFDMEREFPLFSQKVTTESFIQFLAERTTKYQKAEGLVYSSEFSTFLGRSDKDQTLIQTLTDYYDCPDIRSYSTRGRGREEMKFLCLNLLAGSTPEWLKSALPEDAIGGGFLSRLILVHRTTGGSREAFPKDHMTDEVMLFRANCLNDLKIIRRMQGQYEFSPEGKDCYRDWYDRFLLKEQQNCTPFMDGYFGRKGTTVIKMAINLAAGEKDELIITENNVTDAISLLNNNEVFMKEVVEGMAQTEMGLKIDRVRSIILRENSINHSRLMQKVSRQLNSLELRQILDTLIESGEIERQREGKALFYLVKKQTTPGG